ncbi:MULTISPECIES: O-antigen translocase [Maribacter]|uniref:O-antigen translocase n=1 Tax=Maribacter flavus TaxID=1658664 RepID=A0ABU7IMJ8_9FLAO|nr:MULTISPECIES: O-antigen translocase [Maribacter]MDC6407034.1 O-antigen translocase [Maribacter sp. PR66]MEE1974181.1 O-antigen translocase [Maribacter flavus]
MEKSLELTKVDKQKGSSYRQIMKATSIFGGVQVFNILISILRSKIMAVLLGPAGVGILGLLNTTILLISSLTNFGLGISGVKDIATAKDSNDDYRLAKTISVLNRLIWLTGVAGSLITLFGAKWLSEVAFGNTEYTIAFIWLSITVLLKQLASGHFVILQGLRKLKDLAKANMIGSAIGLLLSIPFYYYLGLEGIVPGLVITALATFLVALYFGKSIKKERVPLPFKELKAEGKGMMTMGFMLSLSGIMVLGESYILRVFINYSGGVEEVGLYNAGIALITTYVGLLFTAMETDYYPRLASVASNNTKANELINQQTEIALLILAPVLVGLMVFIDWVIIILYSSEFLAANVMIYWAFLGLFFKVPAWVIGFIFIAKGKSKLFFWNELVSNLYLLLFNILGYHYWGLEGLGISFLVSYVVYLGQVYFIASRKYRFSFQKGFSKIFGLQFILGVLCLVGITMLNTLWMYILGVLLILLSGYFSFVELDKRLGLIQLISGFLGKK